MDEIIFAKVQETLAGALGVDPKEVTPQASLTRDLGAESIDFIDIIFRLEKVFDIKIPSGELFPGNLLNDDRWVRDGLVTAEGLAELKNRVPYMDIDAFAKEPKVSRLAEYFTVDMVVRYVQDRLSKGSQV